MTSVFLCHEYSLFINNSLHLASSISIFLKIKSMLSHQVTPKAFRNAVQNEHGNNVTFFCCYNVSYIM